MMNIIPRINSARVERAFLCSAGAVLLVMGLVEILSFCVDQTALQPRDPLLLWPMKNFIWMLGGVEIAAAVYCLLGNSTGMRTGLVFMVALNLLTYRLAMGYGGVTGGLNGYLGGISDAFGVPRQVVNRSLEVAIFYLFCSSLWMMLFLFWDERQERLQPTVKMFCRACGLHIRFPVHELGRIVSCPGCKQAVTLRRPENLKMACFFCQGHIEFPSHAIEEKMPCPHCKMDITLKEPP